MEEVLTKRKEVGCALCAFGSTSLSWAHAEMVGVGPCGSGLLGSWCVSACMWVVAPVWTQYACTITPQTCLFEVRANIVIIPLPEIG